MRIWKAVFFWYVGGLLYCGLELLWRQHTHESMFVVGGLCFLLIGGVERLFPDVSRVKQMILGAFLVTVTELWSGLIINGWLGLNVWDYSRMPLNLLGQICLPYTLLWIPVCGAGLFVLGKLRQRLFEN